MGQRKKVGKERLDKYYHLAKTQGYRARSAFKLIQLNKKYNFLEKAKVLIDLCAAPGGWLQVAAKYMPSQSLIVGVDLAPIKPIPRVISHVEDITTDSCRSALSRDLKDWKADVILHDGAPNVGSAWVQDAYAQSELVLHSLKLACDFLAPKGTFVTKVFRSKNYNHLLFVFNQLFDKVEATKPPSSRNVSAEIFVVCRGFKAPKKIDPKFLDPRHVFEEIDGENIGSGGFTAGGALNAILYPEKAAKQRNRQGYADGDYTLFHSASIVDFVLLRKEAEAVEYLAKYNQLKWEPGHDVEEDEENLDTGDEGEEEEEKYSKTEIDRAQILSDILKHHSITEEIKICCEDLKVLGRKEYKSLLKWRQNIRDHLFPKKQKDTLPSESDAKNVEITEVDIMEELEEMEAKLGAQQKKAKKKRLEKLTKERRRMQLNMTTPTDIGLEEGGGLVDEMGTESVHLIDKPLFTSRDLLKSKPLETGLVDHAEMDAEKELSEGSDEEVYLDEGVFVENDDGLSGSEADLDDLGRQVDDEYSTFMQKQLEKDPKLRVKQKRSREEEFTGFDDELGTGTNEPTAFDSADDEEPSDMPAKESSSKTKLWFSQPVFGDIDLSEQPKKVNEVSKRKDKADKRKRPQVDSDFSDSEADNATPKPSEYTVNPLDVLSDAQAITMAMEMVRDGGRHKENMLEDLGYRRNVFSDKPGLPDWFLDDEKRHNRPHMPVTKEAVQLMRERQKALDARPIKKVVEAKARKKRKLSKKLDKIKDKMNAMVEDENANDPEIGAKLGQMNANLQKTLKRAKSAERKKPTLVVARGDNRGNKGRPRGVKGKYKMVDNRMKKEVKALKRISQKNKKR